MEMAQTRQRPFGVSLLVVLCDIEALLKLIGGVLGILAAAMMGAISAAALSVLVVAWGLGVLFMGQFLWKGANWARIGFMGLLALGTLMQLPALTGRGMLLAALTIAMNVLFVLILSGRSAREYCGL
jgi:hypothetical protein